MNGSQLLIQSLQAHGVNVIFGYPGGAIMPVYDALYGGKIKHVLCRHEQAAALAADGFARVSGKAGVCLATSGPGATNLITGLANALLDSIPMIAITGQVASSLIGTDAFQEIDTLGLSLSVVKHSFLIESAEEIPNILEQAFAIATSGRPGPVLIDIPKDVQLAEVNHQAMSDVDQNSPINSSEPTVSENTLMPIEQSIQPSDINRASHAHVVSEQLLHLMQTAYRPLLYLGGGVQGEAVEQRLMKWVSDINIPFVTTLKAIGFAQEHPMNLGMLGMHGLVAANQAIQECDLLIALGVRFDDRATGNLSKFAPHAKVAHFDIDDCEIDKLRQTQLSSVIDLKQLLEVLLVKKAELSVDPWREKCSKKKSAHQWRYDHPGTGIYAPRLLSCLTRLTKRNAIISCDVGQHQMWVAQHCQFNSPRKHLSSGGLGTMGFGLPAAIGAQMARPDDVVINVCGDGSFAMNIQELMTLKRYQLPIKILLIDNQSLGMVRQWQHLFFADRYSEIDLSDNPDFVNVSKAFGLNAKRITKAVEEQDGLAWLLEQTEPSLLQVCIDNKENVWPLVPPGAGNHEMINGEQGYEKTDH